MPFKLENIETMVFEGVGRRRFTMRFNPNWMGEPDEPLNGTMYWVEGIGSTMHPFFHLACIHDGCEATYSATCVDSLGVRVHQAAANCGVSGVGIPENEAGSETALSAVIDGGRIRVAYPARFEEGMLTIMEPSGRLLLSRHVNPSMRDLALAPRASALLMVELVDVEGHRWVVRFANVR